MAQRTYLQNRNRLTDIENRFVVAKRVWGGSRMDGDFGVDRSKLTFRMDKKRGPTVQHRELYPISWNRQMMENSMRKRMCIYTHVYM